MRRIKEMNTNEMGLYKESEWGFPKGRAKTYEGSKEAAMREFVEETGIPLSAIQIDQRYPLCERYVHENGYVYISRYYTAMCTKEIEPVVDPMNKSQYQEIGEVKWASIDECLRLFRPYYKEKINLLTKLHSYS